MKTLASNAGGLFCPDQLHPGAFGIPAVRRIEMSGTPAGDLRDGQPHPMTLLDLTCVGSTGTPAADQVADFPGPQAMSQRGRSSCLSSRAGYSSVRFARAMAPSQCALGFAVRVCVSRSTATSPNVGP